MAELKTISIRGAREHNLKNVDLDLPRDSLIVMTGLSGSGKSSLAFDTIYAEGQRRYVESLSAYARQFLEMMQKPDVDQIDGLSPAISIEQKTTSKNPRSTVGTVTEIYDYMRLLFARVGMPYSPATGLPIESQTVSQMVDRVLALEEGTRLYLLAPMVRGRKGEYRKELAELQKKGFQRVKIDGEYLRDRRRAGARQEVQARHRRRRRPHRRARRTSPSRLADSLETALGLADGLAVAEFADKPLPKDRRPTPAPTQSRTRRMSGCFSRRNSPARSRASPSPRSSRGCFRSTTPSAPARAATASASNRRSIPTSSCRNEALTLQRRRDRALGASRPRPITRRRSTRSAASTASSMTDRWQRSLRRGAQDAILYGTGKEKIEFRYDDGLRSYKTTKTFEGVIPNLERRWKETESAWVREEIERYHVGNALRGLRRLSAEARGARGEDRGHAISAR